MPPRKRYFDETSRMPMTPAASHEGEPEQRSLWQRLGGFPGAGAAATRGIAGLLSAGGPEGAAISGGGEALAQYIESFNPDAPPQSATQRSARIAAETGLGAIPFGKWLESGRALTNFLKGAVFSGGGDVARQMAEKETINPLNVDPGRAATAATIGGTASAGVQRFMDFLNNRSAAKAASEAAKTAGEMTVEAPTKTAGGRPVSTAKVPVPQAPKSKTPSSKLADDFLAMLEGERPGVFKRVPVPEVPKAQRSGAFPVPKNIENRHTRGAQPAKIEDFVGDFQKELSKNIDKRVGAASKEAQARTQFESDQYIKNMDAERKLEDDFAAAMDRRNAEYLDEQAAAAAIAKEREGLEEVGKTVTESHTQKIPGGRVNVTKKFAAKDEGSVDPEVLDEVIPPGSKAREVYDSWIAGGLSHEKALEKAARGDVPRGGVKMGKTIPPSETPPAAPVAPTPKSQGPAPTTSGAVPPGTKPGIVGAPIEDVREGFEGSIATLMKRLASLDPESKEAKRILSTIKKREGQLGTAEETYSTTPRVGGPDIEPPKAPAMAEPPEVGERRYLAEWLARDLEDMPFQRGGTTPGQRKAAFENFRPGDPEANKIALGEGFSSGHAPGTPTQEMFNAAGLSGSRGDIAAKLRKMIESGNITPEIDRILEVMRRASTPEGGFDFSKLDDETRAILGDFPVDKLRSPITLPPESDEYFSKYMGNISDIASEGSDDAAKAFDELSSFFGSQVPNAARRADIKDALRTGEERVLQNKQIERFLTPRSDRGSLLPAKAGIDPVPAELAQAVESQPASPSSAIAKFFKSRVDAMGDAYRMAKETPPAKGATEAYKASKRILGKGLQDEAKAAGLPTRGSKPAPPPPPAAPQPGEPGWPPIADIIEQSAPRVAEPEDSELTKLLRFFRNRGEAEAADTSWINRELQSLEDPATLSAGRQATFDPITAPVHQAREDEIAQLMAENRQMQEELALRARLEGTPPPKGPNDPNAPPPAPTGKGKGPKKPPPPPPSATGGPLGPPKLVKPAGDPGAVIRKKSEVGEFRPEVALPMLTTALGGLTGLAYGQNEDEDPVASAILGALAGGAVGFGGANIGKLASKGSAAIGDIAQGVRESLGNREDIAEGVTQAIERFPNLQRANLLTGFNLPVNAAVGPWGSVFFGGLENALANKIAGGTDTRGSDVLAEAMNPVNFLKKMYENRDEAARLVAQGELGRSEGVNLNPGGNLLEQYMALPAVAMTAGDVTARNMLTQAGFPEDIARQITLTSEPVGAVGKAIANFGRGAVNETTPRGNRIGKALLNSMLPFRRTPGNIVDQGWERIPLFGIGAHAIEPGNIDWNEALAQQAISIPLAAASYGLGSELDPETARWVRRVVSNAAGQYSLPASVAFTLGQAQNRGLSNDQTILRATNDAFPLPTTEGITDLGRFLSNTFNGEPTEIPRTMQPTILRDIFTTPEQPPAMRVGGLPNLGEYRRRRRGQ